MLRRLFDRHEVRRRLRRGAHRLLFWYRRSRDPTTIRKLYLDDRRLPPDFSWTLVRWPWEAVYVLQHGRVEELSLDHDLGAEDIGCSDDEVNGNVVVTYLEEKAFTTGMSPPEVVTIHSDNASARQKMLAGIDSARRLAQRFTGIQH